jgi:single-strand DNA-binding protein
MATGVNKFICIGYLGRDPDAKFLPDGTAVTSFSVAVTEKYKDKENTEWINVVTFRRLAEICAQYLTKGTLVYVEGKIRTRSWEDKDGNKRYKTEIIANAMQILKGGNKSEQGGDSFVGDGQEETPF